MSRVAVEYRTNSREVYSRFCLQHPEIKIEFKKWEEVLRTFNESFRDYILETGDRAKMPWGFGDFSISKKKTKLTKTAPDGTVYINLPIDWKKTKEAGKYIYQFNSHTDGYRCRWFWFNDEARFFQSSIWVFKASRVTSRRITVYLNKKSKNYLELYKQWEKT
jgi:hypothetical protein